MVNLPELAEKLGKCGLLQKSFLDCTKSEIEQVINAVFSCVGSAVPLDGWDKPSIINGELNIPCTVHPKYMWWTPAGQGIRQTLIELDAPFEVAKKYIQSKGMTCLDEKDWTNTLIPF